MAAWCLSTGQDVNTWRGLTRLERDVFMQVAKVQLEQAKRRG